MDLLSPLLFVLVGEALNKMFQMVASKGLIKAIKVRRDKVLLMHLQFTDDTLVFSLIDEENI